MTPAPVTVLVVDDEVAMCALLRQLLEDEGYAVQTAHDGQAALEALATTPTLPDVVVSDVMMPRLDGWGLVRALWEQPAYRHIPVILMSAGAELQRAGAGGGAAPALLRKPFELDTLLALLAATQT